MIKILPFWRVVMVGGLVMVGNVTFAQEKSGAPKMLSAGDSLLIKDLYFKGIQQKTSGQLAAAEKTFDRLILLQPDNDAAHFELARIYLENEDYKRAEQSALRATQLDGDNEWYWSMLLDTYRKTGNLKAIPVIFDELIRLRPDSVSYYHDKAHVLYLDKQYDASLAVYDTISARFGEADDQYLFKYQVYLAKGDKDSAIEQLRLLISEKPMESKGYILLAELYTDIGESRKAISLLDEAADLFPDDPLVLLSKSDAYLAMGKQRHANDFLQQAFRSDKLDIDAKAGILYAAIANRKHPLVANSLTGLADLLTETYPLETKAHAVRGDIYMQLNQLDKAREAYLKALDINRYIDVIWQQLLQVELQLGKYDDAEAHGKEALALFPNHPIILFFTGHGFMGNQRYQEARKYLEASLNNASEEHTPLLTQLYSNLGDVYNTLGMYAESDVAYEEAIALDSTNAYALNNYAYYLALRKQKLPLAAEMSKRSNELAPDYPSYQDTYAWIRFQQGEYQDALFWIEKAIKGSDTVSDTLLEHYGDILAKVGDIESAIVQWKKAKTMSQAVGKNIDKLSKKIDAKRYID
ncbi:tetratricopeptide repeat protein [Parapedobacter pyrenivorans]|nr:tetratricopeptide repeat protein [Parapedobacter pyrenivorans]